MTWTTLSLKVTTPLFNGGGYDGGEFGGRPAGEVGLRVPSIRGAMRFWFRALAGSVTGPDLTRLSQAEEKIFGSAEHASPLILRIATQPAVVTPGARHNFLTDLDATDADRRRIIYLMGQSLGDMKKVEISRAYVAPDEDVELKVRFRHRQNASDQERAAIEMLAYASLWLTCAYGGVGARTRRGFGGLRITDADGTLPGPWNASTILTPALKYFEDLRFLWSHGSAGACMPGIAVLTRQPIANPRETWQGKPPLFPVLSVTHAPARISKQTFESWQEVLINTGELLRRFRADRNSAGSQANQPRRETREWADVVRDGGTRFQLGALGLPVVYDDDNIVKVVKASDGGELRRASPLWLRPVGKDDNWRLLSFAFDTEFLPEIAAAHVRLSQREDEDLSVTDQDLKDLTGSWINSMATGNNPVRPPTR